MEIDLLEELRHSVEISLPESPTLHQKVVYESLPKYCNFCHVLGHSRLLYPKASASTNPVSPSQPQAQAAQATKGSVLSRLGPQLSHQGTPPPSQVQGQSQDQDILVASGVATISEADHATTEGWVTVKSRRKSSKQSGYSLKGKEVVVSKPGLDVNTPVTHSSPICT